MKKKALAIFMATALVLSGCSSSETQTTSDQANNQEDVTEDATESEETSDDEAATPVSNEVTIENQEIFNQDDLIVTVTGMKFDSLFGPQIAMLFENNTDKNLTVQARNVSVNGYMVDSSMSADIVSGKKSNDSLTIMDSSLEQCGIENIGEIEFSLHIFNSDDFMADNIDSDPITLHTNLYGTFEQAYDDSGETIYDENGIKIISKGLNAEQSIFGPSVILYVANSSDQFITVQARDTSVNGFMVTPTMSIDVVPGKVAISQMTFLDSDLEDNQIDSINTIETSLHIFGEDITGSSIDTDPITLTF